MNCLLCSNKVSLGRYCAKHRKRRERYGSASARRCFGCKRVFDDRDTVEAPEKAWFCGSCREIRGFCWVDGCLLVTSGSDVKTCRNHRAIDLEGVKA